MKIGVITWYTGENYGTNYQAIALQWILRQAGHDVQLIDYDEALIAAPEQLTKSEQRVQRWRYDFRRYVIRLLYRVQVKKRDASMTAAIRKQCRLTAKVHTESEFSDMCNQFDLLVVGSDQLWNPNWYKPLYFADFDGVHTRKISYAPSIGVDAIPKEKAELIRHGLSGFSAVSVRESTGAELLKPLSPVEPVQVIDPVLLLSRSDWELIFPSEGNPIGEKYVLTAFLTDRLRHRKAAYGFARSKRLKQVTVPYMGMSYLQRGIICADADQSKLLDLIRNAEYVITDSFHIAVMSIIHEKQFFVLERFKEQQYRSTNCRVRDLLNSLSLSERLLPYNSSRIPDLEQIDYTEPLTLLAKESERSRDFLFDAVGS